MPKSTKALTFGKDYIIPKPFDPRLLEIVPAAVAKAAIESGVARIPYQPNHSVKHKKLLSPIDAT